MTANLLCFRSTMFNSTRTRPEWPDRAAFGEDLAEWLRARLQADGWELSRPRWSADAWRLECRGGGEQHELRVRAEGPERWAIALLRTRSWLANLVLPAPAVARALADALHDALLREPSVRELEWRSLRLGERMLMVG
jgi:hypothetical protein